ncbi:MAG TPA: hypothetical protein VIG33_07330 [Pseudobdellovibrionaceae bacterium]|jgi:hypothetical protein
MAKRSEIIHRESLESLFATHPYLLVFKKLDWDEYIGLLAHIYDLLEEENTRVPYDVLKAILIQYYSVKVQNVEVKVAEYFQIMIVELQVLKDSHDSIGKRYIEATRMGKDFLKMMESLLSERRRFSGTGAETLLGALNGLLISGNEMTEEDALQHHKEKIAAYQADIKRIKENGLKAAELLPFHHSNEALFSQAEEAAIHILSATEDVKAAVERERKVLAENYLQQKQTPGANVRTIADFHLNLNNTEEFKSYNQAKELFSQLEGSPARHKHSNIPRILSLLKSRNIVAEDVLKRSYLADFARHFDAADSSIKEKTRVQIRILQQQVAYALTTDSRLIQENINAIFRLLYAHKENALSIIEGLNLELKIPCETDFGSVDTNEFHIQKEAEAVSLVSEDLTAEELRFMMQALLKAEEDTIQRVLEDLKKHLQQYGPVALADYPHLHSLAALYALIEADTLDPAIEKIFQKEIDISLSLQNINIVLRKVPNYLLKHKAQKL